MAQPVVLSWSGGKDSLMALRTLLADGCEVASLVTTVAEVFDRISHHGVRRELLRRQARAIGLPLCEVCVSQNCTNAEYETNLEAALIPFRDRGISTVAFGDIFLEDLREYRERHLAGVGMNAAFPIWRRDTRLLLREFLAEGFRTITVCVDGNVLDRSFVGRDLDEQFLSDLPAGVDPCGENGEFHTFVFEGPLLKKPICFDRGEIVARDQRYFCDLKPSTGWNGIATANRPGLTPTGATR